MKDTDLALLAVKVACVIVREPHYRQLAHRLARAALARDRGELLYNLRIAANARVLPEALARATCRAARAA